MNDTEEVVTCFGITKDPETNNFMMVMLYAENGSLRQYLNNKFNSLHDNGLIHQDFHCGNILSYGTAKALIADLGLCKPANVKSSQSDNKQIFGVLPYVAPEVLRKKYIHKQVIFMDLELLHMKSVQDCPPYHDIAHKELLAISICQGLRPKSNYKIPQLIL